MYEIPCRYKNKPSKTASFTINKTKTRTSSSECVNSKTYVFVKSKCTSNNIKKDRILVCSDSHDCNLRDNLRQATK